MIGRIDFSRLWPGFEPLRFALYNETECCFDGEYVEKTDAFCANTSIEYRGEQTAIWNVMEDMEQEVFASKIVHEMFHGFQNKSGWNCFPNETEALMRYRNDCRALGIKLRENELLLELLAGHDEDKLSELAACRRERLSLFPYETEYEAKTEQTEGTANYVEWKVLEQLAPERARELEEQMRKKLSDPEFLLPARISCYYTGALLVNALKNAGEYAFEPGGRPAGIAFCEAHRDCGAFDTGCMKTPSAREALAKYEAETDAMIGAALEKGNKVLSGPLTLVCPNVYNARRSGGYITSTYFLMYSENGENRIAYGDFVVKMLDENTIEAVYEMANGAG